MFCPACWPMGNEGRVVQDQTQLHVEPYPVEPTLDQPTPAYLQTHEQE